MILKQANNFFIGSLQCVLRSISPMELSISKAVHSQVCSVNAVLSIPSLEIQCMCVCVSVCVRVCACVKSLQLSLTFCDPLDYSPPVSSVHGIFQARIPEWVAISSSRGSSQPKDQTHVSYVSCIGRQLLYYYHHLGSPHVGDYAFGKLF